MNWPNWMEDYVWQWLTVVAIGIISIIVTIVLALRSKYSSQRPNINGDDNIQVTNSPKAKVTINKINPDEYTRNEKHSSKKTIFKLFNLVLKHNET
ncbi:MAG: hypothetical protein K8F52_01835 [Candidatus Scalindua rubra]|uniref:Uncharacterized protein n=1 Tax=Candidatus Scalindua brodae TaxID=237368 RepID=A0A0B0EH98_9BACT|nr:MAG: hypothetical protein SCABRO_02846 [Candidatus Scalindua brodae]MBZ0107383.1 hypothetical protein [Candidatus Scalindua rubra]TWU32767.1 hypothetical protein S225a_17180 [Candidatus Brocadiaceae bacterium S225]